MSGPVPHGLSVCPDKVRAYIIGVLVPLGATQVWLVGSRSGRKNKVPRLDSDWDLEVMGNIDTLPLPTPTSHGIYGEAHFSESVKVGAVQLYPQWEYDQSHV